MPHPRYAIALDDLMQHPRYPEFVQWVHNQIPVAQLDQQAAAARDTHAMMEALAAISGGPLTGRSPAGIPDWVRLSALQAIIQLESATADTCRHTPTLDWPQPVVAAAWKPGMVVCAACIHLLGPHRGSVEDRTCDQWGHLCNPAAGDMVYPSAIQLGHLLFRFGLCGSCRDDMLALPAAPLIRS